VEPFATAIARTHLVLIAISVAVFVYAMSPHDARYFYAGQVEAQALAEFDVSKGYPTVVPTGTVQDPHLQDSKRRLNDVASSFGTIEAIPAIYEGGFERPLPTADSTVSEWKAFLTNPHVQVYTVAPANEVIHRAIELAVGKVGQPSQAMCVTRPALNLVPCEHLSERAMLLSASVEPMPSPQGVPQIKASSARRPDKWMPTLYFMPDRTSDLPELREYGMPFDTLDTDHFLEYFRRINVDSVLAENPRLENAAQPPVIRAVGALVHQVENRKFFLSLQISNDSTFAHWFPTLSNSWTDVANLKPSEAAHYFRAKEVAARQSLSIAGQTLDERVLAFAGPIAVLLASGYLLCNIVAMRSGLRAYVPADANGLQFPRFGLSTSGFPLVLTRASIGYFPGLAALALWVQSDHDLDAGLVAGLVALLLTGYIGWRSVKELHLLRSDLTSAIDHALLRARAFRRAAILEKRALRKQARAGAAHDTRD